jgi:Tol biopolymer transport system component
MSCVPSLPRFAGVALICTVGCSDAPNEITADTTDQVRPLDPSSVIAYENVSELGPTIHVINVDGTGMKRLTPFRATTHAWSPDGARIAFSSTKDGNSDLYVMRADGSDIVRLTNTPNGEIAPSWSPDGAGIVYMRGSSELWVMSSTGANSHVLTAPGFPTRDPAWSPDGSRIAFATSTGVMLIRPDGTGLEHVGPSLSTGSPSWSPDGKRIAYVASVDGNVDIYTIRPDGTDVRRLTTNPGLDTEPAWSPDGAHLAFATDRDIAWHIYTMTSHGTSIPCGVTGPSSRRFRIRALIIATLSGGPERSGPGDPFGAPAADRGVVSAGDHAPPARESLGART